MSKDFKVKNGLQVTTNITASGNISASGTAHIIGGNVQVNELSCLGDAVFGRHLSHQDDSDTKITFETNTISITAGNTTHMGFTQTGGTQILTNITASGNISCSGDYIGNTIQIYNANFQDDLGTTFHYVPIGTNNFEQTSEDNDEVGFVAPYDGELVKIIYRHNFDASSTTTRWTFTKIADGTDLAGTPSTILRATITGATTDDIKEVTLADSDVPGLESAPFSKGDTIFLSIRNSADVTTTSSEFHVTVVLKFNIPLGLI